MSEFSQRIGEEILGAELVAGKEFVEAAGSFWDALEKGAKIYQQQVVWLLRDHAHFWGEALSFDPSRAANALPTLAGDRFHHLRDGFDQYGALLRSEYTPLKKIWSDFSSVVRHDWQRSEHRI